MTRLPTSGLAAAALLACAAPAAGASTRVGVASGSGANAGEAIRITGDRYANDMTITYPRVRSRTAFKLVDRRAIVRVDALARRRMGCRVQGRHTVLCTKPTTAFVYAKLGSGADRFSVRGAPPRPVAAQVQVAAPDGLAYFPQDEGSEGSFLGWIIDGGAGNDRISGSPFFDHVIGGAGNDVMLGRGGDDLFEFGQRATTPTRSSAAAATTRSHGTRTRR